jgi:MFS family permease
MYLVLLALCSLITSMIQGGYLNAISITLQTQFNVPTSKIGIIYSSFDIMGVLATPIVSYIGSRYNKCRVIGMCGFSYALGCAVFTFPYFFSTRYSIVSIGISSSSSLNDNSFNSSNWYNNVDICEYSDNITNFTTTIAPSTVSSFNQTGLFTTSSPASSTDAAAQTAYCIRDASNSWQYYLFIVGQCFMSIGIAPLFSLGVVYLCDNLDESKHALYTGKLVNSFYFVLYGHDKSGRVGLK